MMTIPTDHEHFYHGPHCPVLISPQGECNSDCLEQCIFHGSNCKVGLCLSCFLYGRNGKERITLHHFMPEPLWMNRRRKNPNWEKQNGQWVRVREKK